MRRRRRWPRSEFSMSGKVKITTAHITVTRMHDPAQLALEQALNGTGQSLIWRSVVPLFAADDQSLDKTGVIHVVKGDLLVEFGTGTLFHYDGAFFLVTAAHVFPGWEKKGLEVRIGVDDRSRRLSPG